MGDTATNGLVYRFVWVEDEQPSLGGQWMAYPPSGQPHPVSLFDAVSAHRAEPSDTSPLDVHVGAARQILDAAGHLEDHLFPEPATRLHAALVAADADEPQVDPTSPEGEQIRRTAEALEKVAADLAELVEEQLHGGSLSTLPGDCTRAMCQSIQAGWRLRRLVDPPSPLYL
jgi:hypothetical protein